MAKFGIDVSKWQGANFDFARAKNTDNVEFVILRGAYSCPKAIGNGGKDGQFENYYNKCKALNLPVGVYQYSMATTIEEAKAEAEYLYNNVLKGKQFELPIYIDVEDAEQIVLGKDALTEIVKAWCEYLEARGFWVGVYASLWTFTTHLHDNKLQNYAHWVAQWQKKCTYKGSAGVLGMWQFGGETNLLRTNQIAGQTVDQNYMYIDYPAKIKAAKRNGFGNPATTTTTAKPEYVTYTVQKGDSLWAIAAKQLGSGARYKEIKEINNLKSDTIYAGQTLKIPNK